MEESRINVSKKIIPLKAESKYKLLIDKFILNPFLAGISGFTIFFLLAIFLDFITNLFSSDSLLTIDIFTVLIGIAGFALAFGFSFLESTQKSSDN